MKRAYSLNIKSCRLLKHLGDLRAIFSAYVEVVPACLTGPVVGVGVVDSELAEAVGAEQSLLCREPCHHHFRPMHHRGRNELKLSPFSQLQAIPLLHGPDLGAETCSPGGRGSIVAAAVLLSSHLGRGSIVATAALLSSHLGRGSQRADHGAEGFVELEEEVCGLLAADDCRVGIFIEKSHDRAAVVWLHVLENKIVRLPAAERRREFGHPLPCHACIDSVHHRNPVALDQVTVIAHPFRDNILAFKKINIYVVNSDVSDILAVHGSNNGFVLE